VRTTLYALAIRQVCIRRQVNYWPSNVEHTEEVESDRFTSSVQPIMGVPTKEDLPPVEGGIGDFFQAGERIRQMDEGRRGPWACGPPHCPQPWRCSQHPYVPCVGKLVYIPGRLSVAVTITSEWLCLHCVLLLALWRACCALDSLSSACMHCQATQSSSSAVCVQRSVRHGCTRAWHACRMTWLTLYRNPGVDPWRDQLCWHAQEGPLHEAPGFLDERAEVQRRDPGEVVRHLVQGRRGLWRRAAQRGGVVQVRDACAGWRRHGVSVGFEVDVTWGLRDLCFLCKSTVCCKSAVRGEGQHGSRELCG